MPPHEAAAIVCFVVAPGASAAAASRARCSPPGSRTSRRAASRWSTLFPGTSGPDDTKAADFYHGSLSMFVAAGFAPIATHENVTVVRKTLREP